jgi:hypothetical protein
MKDDFTKNLGMVMVLILGLLALVRVPDLMRQGEGRRRLKKVVAEMQNGDLNREDYDALVAGYYEGLRNDTTPTGLPEEKDDIRLRNDFLLYGFRPNLKRRYSAGMRITNSLGMPNPEYGYPKPPHTRRIALIGDSVSVGPYGQDYEALLEDRLNQANLTPETQRFQILNFAVYGYGVVQLMDVALEQAPKFHPDIYLVALSQLDSNPGWAAHIARLILNGTDLKYDFLRRLVAQAGIRPTDHLPAITRKLAPFKLQVTRWSLEQIRDHAASQSARMVVILVPVPLNPEWVAAAFDELRPAIDSVGVPVIDLRDTFGSENPEGLQVDPGVDIHPNARGHEMIFENLYTKLQAQPDAWAALIGSVGESPDQTKASSTGIGQLQRTKR